MKRKHDDVEEIVEKVEKVEKAEGTEEIAYRSLVRAIAKSAAKKKWHDYYNITNSITSEIKHGFGGYNALLIPVTLVESTTGIRWSERDKDSESYNEIERDVAVLREYYLQAWYLNSVCDRIEECDKQLLGKPENRKMGDVPFIQSQKEKHEADYDKAKTQYFDVFVKNNPRLTKLLS